MTLSAATTTIRSLPSKRLCGMLNCAGIYKTAPSTSIIQDFIGAANIKQSCSWETAIATIEVLKVCITAICPFAERS
jgi:hypothetical protein